MVLIALVWDDLKTIECHNPVLQKPESVIQLHGGHEMAENLQGLCKRDLPSFLEPVGVPSTLNSGCFFQPKVPRDDTPRGTAVRTEK